jgi:hypothetical protein
MAIKPQHQMKLDTGNMKSPTSSMDWASSKQLKMMLAASDSFELGFVDYIRLSFLFFFSSFFF